MPDFDFSIREGGPQDCPAILRLVRKLAFFEKLEHLVSATEEDFKRFGNPQKPYFHTLVAEVASSSEPGNIVGFALYYFTFSTFLGRPTLFLEDLFVEPEYRGRGIGKSLLKALARVALNHHCGRMEWAVLDWNTKAIRFYEGLGAQCLNEWKLYRLTGDAIRKLANS